MEDFKERLKNQIATSKAQIKILKDTLNTQSEQLMTQGLKMIFDQYPELKAITWAQYTPYWNDGETCEFSSGHTWAELNPDEDNEGTIRSDTPVAIAVQEFMKAFDDDMMEFLFGDHVRVTATKEGIEVEDYEHE